MNEDVRKYFIAMIAHGDRIKVELPYGKSTYTVAATYQKGNGNHYPSRFELEMNIADAATFISEIVAAVHNAATRVTFEVPVAIMARVVGINP